MKIFGWMNKKLHLGTTDQYHRVIHRNSPDVVLGDESGGKRGPMLAARAKERDTEALLLPHVLLTIGTLGNQHQQIIQQQEEEEEPLSTDHVQDLIKSAIAAPNPIEITVELISKPAESAEIEKQEVVIEEEITSQEPLLKEVKEKFEKRITLADLFAADTACAAGESPGATTSADKGQTTTNPTNNAKKKTKNKDMESSSTSAAAAATKKIHQMITRMLKKKIHPDQLQARAGEGRHGHGHGHGHGRRGGASDGGEGRRRVLCVFPEARS